AIGTFWDAVTDPIVGLISDNHHNKKFGKRHGFLFVSTIFMCFINVLLWSLPISSDSKIKFFWLLACILAQETAGTFFATPYTALGFELSNDSNEITSLQAFKTFFFLIGMALPSVLMLIFLPSRKTMSPSEIQDGYISIAYVLSMLSLLSGIVCTFGTIKLRDKTKSRNNEIKTKTMTVVLNKISNNKNLKIIILGYAVSMIATSFLSAIGMHFFTYSFHFSALQISILMIVLFSGAIISQRHIIKKSKKTSKMFVLIRFLIVSLISIGILVVLFFLREFFSNSILFHLTLLSIFICGYGSGALYSLPISIYSDLIKEENKHLGRDCTGVFSGIMTFIYKLSNALSLFVIGILLDVIKFNPTEPVQALSVQNSLGQILIVGIAASFALAIQIFSRYKQNKNLL
ncbi:MAG: MFS transporter, partial [Clostridia bacterium]